MPSDKIEGSFVAMITPMNQDGSVDFAGFDCLLKFQVENGSSAVLIMGSTGEVSMLTPGERQEIIEQTMPMRPDGIEIWYGCTGPNTQETINYCDIAAANGADGAIVAAPPYICASEDDIAAYYLEVADASKIPIGIYNNPPRVKTDLSHTALLTLAAHENIVVIKESTSRVGQIAQTAAASPDISLMCCDSPNLGLVIPLMALGGNGTANMSANVIPLEMATISKPWRSWEDACACKDEWLKNLQLLHFLYSATNPVALKSLVGALGLPAGPLRKPLTSLSGAELNAGLRICKTLQLDKKYGYSINI